MREIMIRAHELAATMTGDYSARMALALRQAWAEARNAGKTMEERLVELGGNLWERHGHRRVYFNNLVELYGLELDHYNTGNISSARLDGEGISNNWARQIVSELGSGKLWYDSSTGKFAGRGIGQDKFNKIVQRIREAA